MKKRYKKEELGFSSLFYRNTYHIGGRVMMFRIILVWALLGLGMSGCTIKATTDTSTDGTTEFLSSTTGKSWWTKDGLVKQGEQARAFVALNRENLLQNMAQGHGEYVTALGQIIGIPHRKDSRFRKILQLHYADFAMPHSVGKEEESERFLRQIQLVWTKRS